MGSTKAQDGKSVGRHHLLPGHGYEFRHGAVPLYAKSLVMFTSIDTSVPAGGALAAIRVRIDGDMLSRTQKVGDIRTHSLYRSAHFVAGDDRQPYHRIPSQVGIEIGTAETHVTDT